MKRVTLKGITPNYPIEDSIKSVLWFIGTDIKKERFDDSKFEWRNTGAKIVDRYNIKSGDVIVFEISDSNAEKYLSTIIGRWNKRMVKIEEVA